MFMSKYGVARHIYIPIPKAGSANHAVSSDWTPSAGDVKISKDGGAAANVTNLPSAIAMGNSTVWDFSLTATEMQAAQVIVTVADSATKAVDDTGFIIETYGNASAQHEFDLDTASMAQTGDSYARLGAPAGASVSADVAAVKTQTAAIETDTQDIQSRLPSALVSGRMDSSVGAMAANVLTASAINADAITAAKVAADVSAEIADAVWEEAIADHSGTVGSTAEALNAAGSAGDPWNTALPGAYASGKAGFIVGTYLDAAVSGVSGLDAAGVRSAIGLASANLDTQLTAIDDYLDTEVAAIKAKTDQLTFTTANQVDATTVTISTGAVNAAALASDAVNEIADGVLDRNMATGTDSGSSTVRTVRQALRVLRNKVAIAAGTATVYAEDDSTSSWTAAVTTTAGDPISAVDPAGP